MYCILIDGKCIYACTDEVRFSREATKYADALNASFEFRKSRSLTTE
ncbi:MAG TPA: hypothetical protein VIY48_21950 [Candidatus Paceibacterota bacterium]